MNTTNYIRIFRGDDSDALGYQTIVGTIKTDLDLTGCKAVFRFLGFYAEFDPIPEDKKLTIVIPAQASRGFPPGVGYASLKVLDALGKIRTFTNRIPVIVDTMTPSCGCGEFEVSFSPFPELEPLKIFVGPNADDFDQYTGFISKIIDRASLTKYGLVMLADAMNEDGGNSGKAASPAAVKAAYDSIIATLVDNYYTAEQTDEAIDRVAAYYITSDAVGHPFLTRADLLNAQTYYSGGEVRTPTRNDYAIVLSDEMYGNAEYRYIYAVAEGQTTGSWQPQYPVEGVMTVDQEVTKDSANPVASGGVWSAIWGALAALPTGFSSLYGWCVSQLAGKQPSLNPSTVVVPGGIKTVSTTVNHQGSIVILELPTSGVTVNGKALTDDVTLTGADIPVDATQGAQKINTALAGKASIADATLTDAATWACNPATDSNGQAYHVEWQDRGWATAWFLYAGDGQTPVSSSYSTDASATRIEFTVSSGSVVATRAASQGYQLGDDDQHILASEAEAEALRTAMANKADVSAIPYDLGTPIVINTASSETVEGETVYYGAATLANRTANIVQVTETLDELRITFPAATSGKVRDFGLRVEIGTGSAALAAPALVPIAPTGETIKIENADGTIPELADGTATAKGVTLLYFSETAPGVFVVKGEQVEEVA